MTFDEQKDLAHRIAELLARLHPEEPALLRIHLAFWLVRRVARNQEQAARSEKSADAGPGSSKLPGPEYEI